jgi:hypothetical protein
VNNFETLLGVLLKPFQRLENAMIQVRDGYDPDTAVGVQLESDGKLVGQPRAGLADDVYRRYIKARILVNRSTGKREELLKIGRLILGDDVGTLVIRGRDNATCYFEVRDRATTDAEALALQTMLTTAAGTGIRIIVEWSAVALAQTFRFDAGPGFDQGHLARGVDAAGTV